MKEVFDYFEVHLPIAVLLQTSLLFSGSALNVEDIMISEKTG